MGEIQNKKDAKFNLRVSKKDVEALMQLQALLNVSRSQVIRDLIQREIIEIQAKNISIPLKERMGKSGGLLVSEIW